MKMIIRKKGGSGSGHHGHRGRPGEVGGGLPDNATVGQESSSSAPFSKRDFKRKYPSLYTAIDMMVQDNGGRIKDSISADFALYNKMDRVDPTLNTLDGKTLREVLPKDTDWDMFDETPYNDALEAFVIGEGSMQDYIVESLGNKYEYARNFLYAVFDGEYSDTFTTF